MAVGNGNCKEMRPHCSWLVYWSGASGGPGHFTAITAPTVATTFFKTFFCSFFFAFPTFWHIYIFIYFFTPWGYHYSNCSHMNTGVVSIGYKCVFLFILGPGLGLLSQLHINVPFLFALFVVYVFFFFLHKKSVHLVQRLLLYPDDGGHAGRPPQLPPQDVLAELGRVHSSSTGAHNFKSSLLQPLEDLDRIEVTVAIQWKPNDVRWVVIPACVDRVTHHVADLWKHLFYQGFVTAERDPFSEVWGDTHH